MPTSMPAKSELATTEGDAAYERWFRAKVLSSLDDPRPAVPHDDVMAEMDALITEVEHQQKA